MEKVTRRVVMGGQRPADRRTKSRSRAGRGHGCEFNGECNTLRIGVVDASTPWQVDHERQDALRPVGCVAPTLYASSMPFTALHRALGISPGPLTDELLEAAVLGGVVEGFNSAPARRVSRQHYSTSCPRRRSFGQRLGKFGAKKSA
jgi:hypothetical protein